MLLTVPVGELPVIEGGVLSFLLGVAHASATSPNSLLELSTAVTAKQYLLPSVRPETGYCVVTREGIEWNGTSPNTLVMLEEDL